MADVLALLSAVILAGAEADGSVVGAFFLVLVGRQYLQGNLRQ